LDALLAAVHGAIIDDPKHKFGRAIGLLVHDLADQTIKVLDPVLVCATTEDFGAPDDQGSEPPFPETMDRAGKSSFDNAKVEWRLG
jgi:hypothetical protein